MKKIVILLFVIVLLFSCGKKKSPHKKFDEIVRRETASEIGKTQKDTIEIEKEEEKIIEQEEEAVIEIEEQEKKIEAAELDSEKQEKLEKPEEKEIKSPVKYVTKSEKKLSVAELWSGYKNSKAKLEEGKEEEDFPKILSALQEASEFAIKLDRNDIAAWQLNNIGYFSIEEFKKLTDYNKKMGTMRSMKAGDDKIQYTSEAKNIFKKNFNVLKNAKKSLLEAQELDKALNDENRTRIIKSNIDFINEIDRFIQN